MVLGSVTAKNLDLAACYGDSHSSAWPVTVYLALFVGDPTSGGVELTVGTGGYDRLALDNDSFHFAAPSGGSQANAMDFTFPACTGPWSGDADHWGYMSLPTAGDLLDCGALAGPITGTALGIVVNFPAGSLVVSA